MKPDETEKRLKNALIYGTSHPEAYMTKADELWKKYSGEDDYGTRVILEEDFLAALNEYVEHFKAEAVKVCMDRSAKHDNADRCETAWVLAVAIQKMELP